MSFSYYVAVDRVPSTEKGRAFKFKPKMVSGEHLIYRYDDTNRIFQYLDSKEREWVQYKIERIRIADNDRSIDYKLDPKEWSNEDLKFGTVTLSKPTNVHHLILTYDVMPIGNSLLPQSSFDVFLSETTPCSKKIENYPVRILSKELDSVKNKGTTQHKEEYSLEDTRSTRIDIAAVENEIARLEKNGKSFFGIRNQWKADKIKAALKLAEVNTQITDVRLDSEVQKALSQHRIFGFFGWKTANAMQNVEESMKEKGPTIG